MTRLQPRATGAAVGFKNCPMDRKLYPNDISTEEWNFVALYLTLIDEEAPRRRYPQREMFNALRWLARAEAAGIELQVVKMPEAKKRFVLLPRRWVVEVSFGWVVRFRRLSRDFELLPQVLAGLRFVAFAMLMATQGRGVSGLGRAGYKSITRTKTHQGHGSCSLVRVTAQIFIC